METHLRFEPDIKGDIRKRGFPIHIIFNQDTLSYDEFKSLQTLSFRIISRPDSQWETVPFIERIDREFVLRSLLYEKCKHLSADPGDMTPVLHGGDDKCMFGLVFSVILDIDNDWYKDVLKFRLNMGAGEMIDIDFTFVRVIRDGLRFFNTVRETHPRDVQKRKNQPHSTFSKSAEGDDFELPEGVIPAGPGFFELNEHRKMSNDMEERLSRFAVKRVSVSDFGPLEPPSKIRGKEVKSKKKEFFTDSDNVVVPTPVRSRSDRWFSGNNAIRVSHVQEIVGFRRFAAIWYSESCGTDVDIDVTTLDDAEAVLTSFQYTRRWETAVTRAYANTVQELTEAVSRFGALTQRFYVNLWCNISGRDLLDLICLSRDAWLVNGTGIGCIIKAVSSDLYQRRQNNDNNGWRVGWADVIWHAQGRVTSGIPVKLTSVGCDGLWRSFFESGTVTDWELNPEVCVLYAFPDKSLTWVLPGGFCVSFQLRINDADVKIIREKFKTH